MEWREKSNKMKNNKLTTIERFLWENNNKTRVLCSCLCLVLIKKYNHIFRRCSSYRGLILVLKRDSFAFLRGNFHVKCDGFTILRDNFYIERSSFSKPL